jgi:hypothetical protein
LNDPGAPSRIFEWLKRKLRSARERNLKVFLVYHIPHGEYIASFGAQRYWIPKSEEQLKLILKEYKDIITTIFTGHLHVSAFNVIKDKTDNEYYGGVIVNRAVSPLFGNNPGFTIYYYYEPMKYPERYEEFAFLLPDTYNNTESASKYWVYLNTDIDDLQPKSLQARDIAQFLDEIMRDCSKMFKYTLHRLGKLSDDSNLAMKVIQTLCSETITNKKIYEMCV